MTMWTIKTIKCISDKNGDKVLNNNLNGFSVITEANFQIFYYIFYYIRIDKNIFPFNPHRYFGFQSNSVINQLMFWKILCTPWVNLHGKLELYILRQ